MPAATQAIFERLYARAGQPERLPWYDPSAPPQLVAAADAMGDRGRALDIGCGTGTNAVWLARRGFAVTAFDFVDKAVRLTRERAAAEGVTVDVSRADALAFEADAPFDLVHDRGMSHGLADRDLPAFRRRLLSWLAPGGHYVVTHALRRHPLDRRPVGPIRRRREDVVAFVGDGFRLRGFTPYTLKAPLPIGPTMASGEFWFQRD